MSGHTRHPDTEDLADFQAGLVTGARGKRLAAHVARCSLCASVRDQIVAVSGQLAAAPALMMPSHVERKITAALMTETAARDARARPAQRAVPDDRPGRHARLWSRRVQVFSRTIAVPQGALVSAAVCLLLAAVGYVLSLPAGSPSHPASVKGLAGSGGHRDTLSTGARPVVAFVVTDTGTDYQATTLQTQVREELQAQASAPSVAPAPVEPGSGAQSVTPQGGNSKGPQPGSSSAAGAGDVAPPSSLVGCVMHLTGDQEPAMVDRAVYESRPAYVIAVSDHAWVVSLNCTAAHPAVIESVALSPAA
jgi:hypothetical protein